jgi:hypothetical protein
MPAVLAVCSIVAFRVLVKLSVPTTKYQLARVDASYFGIIWVDSDPNSLSRPVAEAAFAIPDLTAFIFSAYCNDIRVDFHPPACVISARSI